jgi:hypothetical protein
MDEKRFSKSSSIFSENSKPLASLTKCLTTWDLNFPDDQISLQYSFEKDNASTLKDDDYVRNYEELVFKQPVQIILEIEEENSLMRR